MIDRDELSKLIRDPDSWLRPLNDAMRLYGIDSATRVSQFMAQCLHESDSFLHLSENLNYSPSVLLQVFGRHFTPEEAVDFAHDQERIANRVYADRMGNGDEASGDGWRYRGRGIIQLTGRDNYTEFGKAIGTRVENNPDLLTVPQYAALAAAWFWDMKGCNELADAGNFIGITRRINGGVNGLQDRADMLAKAKMALDVDQA